MAVATSATATDQDVRPHPFDVPDEQLDDLRRRITATKWPDREVDPSQGVRLETIQALAAYWATDYDWRALSGASRLSPTSSPRSTGSTSTSSTSAPRTTT